MAISFARIGVSAMAIMAAFPAAAQEAEGEVVMRRPLPVRPSGPGCTPGEPGCQEQTSATSANGWLLNCSATPKATCNEVTRSEAGVVSATPVDAGSCSTAQSAAQNTLAQTAGMTHMPGIAHDFDAICDGDEPGEPNDPTKIYFALGTCENGTLKIDCFGLDAVNSQVPPVPGTIANCAAQEITPQYDAIEETLPPMLSNAIVWPDEVMERNGEACDGGLEQATTYGRVCSMGVSECRQVDYTIDAEYNISVVNISEASEQSCENLSLDWKDTQALDQMSISKPSENPCAEPVAYVANGTCKTNVTYDPGWPNSGQAHVDTTFQMNCYSVSDWLSPFPQINPVPSAFCDTPQSAAQQQIVDEVVASQPEYKDPQTIDRTCDTTGGVVLNYQRDTYSFDYTPFMPIGSGPPANTVQTATEDGGRPWYLREYYAKYRYVCTDVDPGDDERPAYFNSGTASNYQMNLTCQYERMQDMNELQAGKSAQGGYPSQTLEQYCSSRLPSELSHLATQCGQTATDNGYDVITVTSREWEAAPW